MLTPSSDIYDLVWEICSTYSSKPEASGFYHLARRLSEPRVVVFSPEVEAIRNPGRDLVASMKKLSISTF